ncbi:MAG: branched-chain amino acid ABC transporter permease [Catenulispora sp.]|nr:branched-chain amino acid ABC transporter permease [Catenulispora sp.]
MTHFLDLTLTGVTDGAVYAAVALALVLIWRSTRVVNFAQGGMAMATTFVAWDLVHHGHSYWLAALAAIGVGLVLGAAAERLLIRPVERAAPLNAVIVALGLLVLLQAGAGMIWGGQLRSYPSAFGIKGFKPFGHQLLFSPDDLFMVASVAAVMLLLVLLFRFTPLGLRMRAAAFAPEVSRLLGIRVGRLLTLGWALAAAVGAVAGILIAPTTFVGPSQFDPILVSGFTAAVIGGLDSPVGAVAGGITLGCALSYVAGYVSTDIGAFAAFAVLITVLMLRPNGLFAGHAERRV